LFFPNGGHDFSFQSSHISSSLKIFILLFLLFFKRFSKFLINKLILLISSLLKIK
jgi:hypothetical protein